VHEYIELWWKRAAQFDPESFELAGGFQEFREQERKQKSRLLRWILPFPYAVAIQCIPVLFILGWIALLLYSFRIHPQLCIAGQSSQPIGELHNLFDPILALAALVTAGFAIAQASAARANAAAAQASAEGFLNSQRPWVLVENTGSPESWYSPENPAYTPGMVFAFKVYGNTPAKVTEARFQLIPVLATRKDVSLTPDLPLTPKFMDMCRMPDIPEFGIVLPPGKSFELRLGLGQSTLTEQQWIDLRDQKYIMCAYGIVRYEDTFGGQRETRVCYGYDFAWGGVITAPDGTRLNPPGFRLIGPPQYNKAT
jgi:hypothetical protein